MSQERQSPAVEPRVGVYVCHCGGNISDQVDVERVAEEASRLPGVTAARHYSFMCSDPGQQMILEDLTSGRVDRVVVASCAPALHETTFREVLRRAGVNPYLYEHANIREQVSWVHHGPGATAKAAALVAAATAKARELAPLMPIRVAAARHATVIGGGVAGLTAALDLAARGVEVALVEATPFLGGNLAGLDRTFPTNDPAAELLTGLARRVLAQERITLYTCARLTGFSGYVGGFHLTIGQAPPSDGQTLERLARFAGPGPDCLPFLGVLPIAPPQAERQIELTTGAVVLATGFRHHQPPEGEYGYRHLSRVLTLPEFIALMAAIPEGRELTFEGAPVASLALIHCVGSRQIPGVHQPAPGRELNQHCSRVCCTASLQAAGEARRRFPETTVYELYRDIRSYGRGHEDYYLRASRSGVVFARFNPEDPPRVQADPSGDSPLKVTVRDTILAGEELELGVDLVVLAVGMEPGPAAELIQLMKLPQGADGFLQEVHPKLRPVELASAGLFLAGTCQAPMDVGEAASAAAAAAVKAAGLVTQGYVELEPFVASVDQQRCDGCGDCVTACLRQGALTMAPTAAGTKARVEPALCLGCGVCVAACPQEAIQVAGWSLPQFRAMVQAIARSGAEQGERA